jgi:hypothetical protein
MKNDIAPRWLVWIALVAILAGGAVRLWVLTQRGSLWLDEASLALNILGRGFAALARPLDWGQAAPAGFLWIEKAFTLLLGSSEWVLRLWPFLAGVAVLPLTWVVGRKLVGEGGALLATSALGFSLLAIRYSAEVKPYASDAMIALALVFLATRVIDQPEDKKRWRTLRLAGVLAILLSLPSAFVLGAIGAALFLITRKTSPWPRIAAIAASLEWLTTFAIMWFVVVRTASGGAYLKEYWAPVMLDVSAPNFVARLFRLLASVSSTPIRWDGELWPAVIAMVATLCGLAFALRKSLVTALLLGGPTVLAALASLIGLYPMSDRLAFFAAPLMILAAGKCVAGIVTLLAARGGPRVVGAALVAASVGLAFWIGGDSMRIVRAPGQLEATRGIFTAVRADAKTVGVPVYVFSRGAPAWIYETTEWGGLLTDRFTQYRRLTGDVASEAHENFARTGPVERESGDGYFVPGMVPAELIGLAPGVRYRVVGGTSRSGVSPGWAEEEARRISAVANPSAWIVASHFFEGTTRDELAPLLEALKTAGFGVREERRGGRDALALLVQRRGPLPPPR